MTPLEKLAIEYVRARETTTKALDDYAAYHSKRPQFNKAKITELQETISTSQKAEFAAYFALRDYVHEVKAPPPGESEVKH